MPLKLTLLLIQEFGVTHLQAFGDSILVIQYIHKDISPKSLLYNICMMKFLIYSHVLPINLCPPINK